MISDNLKILDCTLREGGYVNNWDFKFNNISGIISNLIEANIDYVECGFLKPVKYDKNKSLFSDVLQLQNFSNNNSERITYTLMINCGEYDVNDIPQNSNDKILLRIAFKKDKLKDALNYSKKLQDKGYGIFINPMHTNIYSKEELLFLIEETNKIQPYGFTITDTTGSMKENDVVSIFNMTDKNLKKDISLCFHSHNNLRLSFSNTQNLIKINNDRELIIDSTLRGMGRGAGNLGTEFIADYLNKNYNKNYDLVLINKIIEEKINPIYQKHQWGYCEPYYLSAINKCHPNYAKYFIDKNITDNQIIAKLLESIPEDKKIYYNRQIIEKIYNDKFKK